MEEHLCAFCRTPETSSDGVKNRKLEKPLVEKGNADAFYQLAFYFAEGSDGMPQDLKRLTNYG